MSGALNSVYNNVTFALHLHSKALASLQENVSTGSRINRASDEPSSAYRVLGINSQQRYLSNYIDTISSTINAQNMASSVLLNMTDTLMDIRVRLTQVTSGTYGEGEAGQAARQRTAQEINDVLEQMVSSANTNYMGQYFFGGSNTNSPPYVIERSNDQIVRVTYQGGSEGRKAPMASGIDAYVSFAGSDIFKADNRGTPVFYGSTGARAGTGTSSVRGEVWLTVGYDEVNSTYKLSIDGGTTWVDVPTAPGDNTNVAVTNAYGEVLYIDASSLSSVGQDRVKIPGTYDVFNTLINTRDLLMDPKGLSASTLVTLMEQAATAIEASRAVLTEKTASMGSKINFLDELKNSLENIKANGQEEATLLQEADIAQIAIDISRRDTLYQMSLSVAAKLMSMSLLDFIR
jgi:flagellar hook-associated protein 3 FlgL